jgi:hypothetical protein
MGSLNEMDQLGLNELLDLMRDHDRHLRAFGEYFANFKDFLERELELWPVLGEEAQNQINIFGDAFISVFRLQDQIRVTLVDLAETLMSQQINQIV